MPTRTEYGKIVPYTTKDGSVIRELMHPGIHGSKEQSLAEALVPPDTSTLRHRHLRSEELYHVVSGAGAMVLGDEEFIIKPRDTVCIPPGTPHMLRNTGQVPLKVLCCCSPPYSHTDTELL